MTNIDSVLRTYFVDVDINDVIESMNSMEAPLDEGLSPAKFKACFLKHNSKYGLDIIGSIHNMANDFWLTSEHALGKKSVFNILDAATKNVLEWNHDEPVCHFGEYLRWNELTSIVGEDLLTTAFLAKRQQSSSFSVEPKSFGWKPYVITKNQNINQIMGKGLHELHFHLNGSSLVITINWLSVMNQKNGKLDAVIKDFGESFVLNTLKAKYIRYCLFTALENEECTISEKLYNQLINVVRSKSVMDLRLQACTLDSKIQIALNDALHLNLGDKFAIDYALRSPISELDIKRYYNIPLIGERRLLYKALLYVYRQDKRFNRFRILLYIYLLAKNQFRQKIIQNDDIKGFAHFQDVQDRKDYFVKEKKLYKSLYTYMSAQSTIGNQPIKSLEMRIAPKSSAKKLAQSLKNANEDINMDCFRFGEENVIQKKKAKIGYIIHFIKEDKKDQAFSDCRNGYQRSLINRQAEAIATLVRKNSMYVKGGIVPKRKENAKDSLFKIVGIDAANSEFCCRPEVFASVFRYLKDIRRNSNLDYFYEKQELNLGRTFHVGEDFYDIIDGLRAIDESLYYLNLKQGDRLGHAVALGIDSYEYYKTRNFRIVLPRQVLLDNVVWLYKKMLQYSISDKNGLMNRLNREFQIHSNAIYADECTSFTIDEYYQSWLLRGDNPEMYKTKDISFVKPYYLNRIDSNLDIIRKNENVTAIFKAYLFDKKVVEAGRVCVEFCFEDSDSFVIEELQKKMMKKIVLNKISVECNPTSNLRITDIERYVKHPIVKFNNYKLVENPSVEQVEVSINTDDQGVFATSLEKEFTLMAEALEKKRDSDGNPEYVPQKIYDWLDSVRESAQRSSFLNDAD